MNAVKRFFLALCLLCAPLSSRAQEAAPVASIVDVLPTVEPNVPPLAPLIAFDLLVGMMPRPVWWGRHFGEDRYLRPRDFSVNVQSIEHGPVPPSAISYACAYQPRWNEALGLYTVHVRVSFKGETWSRGTAFRCSGELPFPFDGFGSALPFEVVASAPTKKVRTQVELVAPHPSLWVKSARVLRVTWPRSVGGAPGAKYQLDVTMAGPYEVKREMTLNSVSFVDAQGKEVNPIAPAGWGSEGSLDDLTSDLGEPEFAGARLRFVSRRAVWDEGVAQGGADLWAKQTFAYGGRTPITLTVPVQRDGKLLEGEIAPRDWKIEFPVPKPN